MSQVVSFEDYRPSPRYDSLPWTDVKVEEGTASDPAVWTLIDTLPLTPVDSDPANPAYRNFTTSNASDDPDLWYRLTFIDAALATAQPTTPIQNTADERPVYATTTELALLLRVDETQRRASLTRVLKAAAAEIDNEIGAEDIEGTTLPYSSPPALVTEVNLHRARDLWMLQQQSMGIYELGDAGALYTPRDSWDRHANTLRPLKADWGIA